MNIHIVLCKCPSKNKRLLGLDAVFLKLKIMEVVLEHEGSTSDSLVSGQGKGAMICGYRGDCNSKSCKCFKAGQIFSSACHHNNAKCNNHDHNAD
jgi:hypothetical protein